MANELPTSSLLPEAPPPVTEGEMEDSRSPPLPVVEPDSSAITEREEPRAQDSKSLAAMMQKEGSVSPPSSSADTKEEVVVVETKEEKQQMEERKVPRSLVSFKEESNVVGDLSDFERKAFEEFKRLVQEALQTRQFVDPTPTPTARAQAKEEDKPQEIPAKTEALLSESDVSTEIKPSGSLKTEENPEKPSQEEATKEAPMPEEVSIWGIPLLKDDRSDVILLKFLRARDFKMKDAFIMMANTIKWRKAFKIDELIDEDLGDSLDKVVFMHGHDRDGHPVCYNVYGEFQNKELYQKAFSDEEKRMNFLRWRIQFLERSIRKLDFRPGGCSTIFQVNDLKNSPGLGKRELRLATKQALQVLQDNYPEFVAKQVFINVPWWHLAFFTMMSPFMTQRTKNKFVFASPAKSAEKLFKYISPEQVPIQYGGLSVDYCDCNPEFTVDDPATEITVKPATKQTVEIIIYEKCIIIWEIRVVGWDVSYGAEFVPDVKDAYTIIINKPTKMAPTDEPVVSSRFKVGELGKILLKIDNPTSKKKKLLYRFNIKPLSD